MRYDVCGFIDCMWFKSIFYKTNINFPRFSECHACLYHRIVPVFLFEAAWGLETWRAFLTEAEFYSHEFVEWKAGVHCAAGSFHWRKESCHMVYQGSESTDVSLGCCHGFKVAWILVDSWGEDYCRSLSWISTDACIHAHKAGVLLNTSRMHSFKKKL